MNIYIYGTGDYSINVESLFMMDDEIVGYIETIPNKKIFNGKKVYSIEELSMLSDKEEFGIYISVSKDYKQEIYRVLSSYDLLERVLSYPSFGNVNISKDASVTPDCVFEGENFIRSGCIVSHITMGKKSYISYDSIICNCKIGRFCSIGQNVAICPSQHNIKCVSTSPYFEDNEVLARTKYECVIGNDVWIGKNVVIMEGVKVGDGAVIGAGAVVTKNVESYSVYGGVPAKKIKMRFTKSEIDFLEKLKWWEKDDDWIELYKKDFVSIDQLMRAIKKDYKV